MLRCINYKIILQIQFIVAQKVCFQLRMVLLCLVFYCCIKLCEVPLTFQSCLCVQLLLSERSYLRQLIGNRKIGEIQ